MIRVLLVLCINFALAGGISAGDLEKHLDPPGPPKVEEFVYLYELTLTQDEDDGILFFDGDTEILVTTTIEKVGHETFTWARLINDIDMDGDLANDYRVLNGDEEDFRAEQKGGKAKIFSHFECTPLANMNLDIEVFEVNSFGIGDVLVLLGKSAGALEKSGLLGGYTWVGDAAEEVGGLIDGVGEEEDSLGTDSGVIPAGISSVKMPTISYQYRTEYVTEVIDSTHCDGDDREEGWKRSNDPGLDDAEKDWYGLWGKGYDAEHPFTKSPKDALNRSAWLLEALEAVEDIDTREGETPPDIGSIQGKLRTAISDIACATIYTEIEEAFADPAKKSIGDNLPPFVFEAHFAWEEGVALAASGDHAGAVDSCLLYLTLMLTYNHPTVFFNGFESEGTLAWSIRVGEVVVED